MLKAPLVIALPTDYRSRARDLAPDLWHVRATSVELESGRFPAPPSPDARRSAATGRDDFGARAASSVDAEAARAIPEDVLRSLSTWKHLFRHASPVQVDPWIGIETVDLLRQHGFPERAREVATQVVDIARVQARSDDPVVPHERRRVLSAALDRLGDVSQEPGRLEAAAGACEESLALRRQLRTALGDTPQVLSDLAQGEVKFDWALEMSSRPPIEPSGALHAAMEEVRRIKLQRAFFKEAHRTIEEPRHV